MTLVIREATPELRRTVMALTVRQMVIDLRPMWWLDIDDDAAVSAALERAGWGCGAIAACMGMAQIVLRETMPLAD